MMAPIGDGRVPARVPITAFLSTYVPRRCGIATFTRDLVEGLRAGVDPEARVSVIALERRGEHLAYPPVVRRRLPSHDRAAYPRLAAELAADGVEVLSVQHEYGIFGGPSGVYLLDLLDAVPMPVVTTLHTILARPTPLQQRVLERLAARSARVVAMTERGRTILVQRYGVAPEKVEIIPHGVPDFDAVDPVVAKARVGASNAKLILSFGLLGPHKNVELVLDALARIADQVPDARYAVVGATHPDIRRKSGERYRAGLVERAAGLGLDGRVQFVDRYVDDPELATWLAASDVFVTPYRNAQQITSGTLAYALAAGTAVVSTPYEHASELLGDGRGILVPFDDADALSGALARLLTEDDHRRAMSRRAREHGRSMIWSNVARRYAELFAQVVADRAATPGRRAAVTELAGATTPRPAVATSLPALAGPIGPGEESLPIELAYELPVARRHLDELGDRLGIFQFAIGHRPDPEHGYCTDDVARALRVDLRHAEIAPGPAVAAAIRRDVAFLHEAFDPVSGRLRNFRTIDGRWRERIGSEDAHGRAVQALGETVARCHDQAVVIEARRLLAAALPATVDLEWARPRAYSILGCAAALDDPPSADRARSVLNALIGRLAESVRRARRADPEWPWPEDLCTYDNGVVAEALLGAGSRLGQPILVASGIGVLDWLVAAETGPSGRFQPIGNRGWWPRGAEPARWDQQPIEPASIASAAVAAWEVTGEDRWAQVAERALAWFLGANDLGVALADPERGACRDGLGPDGPNVNEGAESTLAWLLAVERIRELRQGRSETLRESGLGQERTYASTSDRRAVARATAESAAP